MFSPLLGQSWGTLVDPFGSSFLENGNLDAPMDWREMPEAHVFNIDLPGLAKEDVNVELVPDMRVLEISAERKEDEEKEEGKGHKWHYRERTVSGGGGGYSRQFQLPEDAEVDGIKASMRDGVLTVVVPNERDVLHVKKHRHNIKAIKISDEDKHRDDNGKGSKGGISRMSAAKLERIYEYHRM